MAGTLRAGDALDQGVLFAELTAASVEGRDWLVQAEGRSDADGLLLLVVSVVPGSAGPRIWVVAEGHTGGLSATRLVPVLQPERTGAWACARERVQVNALTVTEKR